MLHQIPFTSYGNTVFSNISLLIDNLALQKSTIGKKAADFALVTYVEHLILDDDQAIELIGLLDEKYKVKSQRGLDLILERVKDGLEAKMRQIGAEETETIETARINRKRGR